MTLAATTTQTTGSTTNGVTTTFSFSFRVDDFGDVDAEDQLEVVLVTTSSGAETTLTKTTHYTVSINGDQDSAPGGSITTVATYASGYTLYIRRNPSFLQNTSLQNQGPYLAEVVETTFDQVVKQVQDLRERLYGAPHLGVQKGASFDGRIRDKPSLNGGKLIKLADDGLGYDFVSGTDGSSNAVTTTGADRSRALADRFADYANPLDYAGDDNTERLRACWADGHRKIYIPPSVSVIEMGTDTNDKLLSSAGEDVKIYAPHTTFRQVGDYRIALFKAGWLNTTAIASHTTTTITLASGQGANWAAGDWGRIRDDNDLPIFISADKGEDFYVFSVSGDILTVTTLFYTYTTNARVGKRASSVRAELVLGAIEKELGHATTNPDMITLEAFVDPDVRVGRGIYIEGTGLASQACLGGSFYIGSQEDGNYTNGYPIGIRNSSYVNATVALGGNCRHIIAMTADNTSGFDDLSQAGHTFRCNGYGKSIGRATFDTHHGTRECRYISCESDRTDDGGFSIRGVDNEVVDAFFEGKAGTSLLGVFRQSGFTDAEAVTSGTKLVRPRGAIGAGGRLVQWNEGGGDVTVIDPDFSAPCTGNTLLCEVGKGNFAWRGGKATITGTPTTNAIINTETGALSSTIIDVSNVEIDASGATGTSFDVVFDAAAAGPKVRLNGLRIRGGAQFAALYNGTPASGCEFGDIMADTLPTVVTGQTVDALRPYLTGPLVSVSAGIAYQPLVQRVLVEDSGTNTVLNARRASRSSSGTPAAGIGVGDAYEVETAAGNYEVGAVWEYSASDVSAGAEHFDAELKMMRAGAAAARALRVRSDGTFDHVMPANGAGATLKHATTLLSSVSGATVTATSLIPAGARVISVTTRVTTALGGGGGTTGYTVGDGSDADRWGVATTITLGTQTGMIGAGAPTADPAGYFVSANNVVITAVGGNFNGTGAIRVVVSYWDGVAPTS